MFAGAGVAAVFWQRDKGTAFYLGLIVRLPCSFISMLFTWKAWDTSSIPWGYWGRETHHADLGYAAGQAVVLLAAAMAAGNSQRQRWTAGALIIACLLSTALAKLPRWLGFCFSRRPFCHYHCLQGRNRLIDVEPLTSFWEASSSSEWLLFPLL